MIWKEWPPRDWRAFLALTASVAGAATLTGLLGWTIAIFRDAHAIDPLAKVAYGLLVLIGITLSSLGLAINRRSLKMTGLGASLDMSGGDPDDGMKP